MSISAKRADEIAGTLSREGRDDEAQAIRHAVSEYFSNVEGEINRRPYEPRDSDVSSMAEANWENHLRDEYLSQYKPSDKDLVEHLIYHSNLGDDVADQVQKQFAELLQRWIILGAKDGENFYNLVMAKIFGSELGAHSDFLSARRSDRYGSDWISGSTIREFSSHLHEMIEKAVYGQEYLSNANPSERAMHSRQFLDMARGNVSSMFPDLLRRAAKVALFASPGRTAGEWIEPYREVYTNEAFKSYEESIREDVIRNEYGEIYNRIRDELESRDMEAGETLGLSGPLLPMWESGAFSWVVDEGMLQFVSPDCPAYGLDIDLITRLLSHVYGEYSEVEPFNDVLGAAVQNEREVAQLVQKAGISPNG